MLAHRRGCAVAAPALAPPAPWGRCGGVTARTTASTHKPSEARKNWQGVSTASFSWCVCNVSVLVFFVAGWLLLLQVFPIL